MGTVNDVRRQFRVELENKHQVGRTIRQDRKNLFAFLRETKWLWSFRRRFKRGRIVYRYK